MNCTRLLVVALVVSCGSVFAQQGQSSHGFVTLESLAGRANPGATGPATVQAEACPVGLQAKQGGTSDLVKVRRAPDSQPEAAVKPGQHIHLIVTNPSKDPVSPKIVGATVTARGLTARGRVDRSSTGSGDGDVRRTMEVTFTGEGDQSFSAELVLPGFTSVKSIRIEALAYADGSTRDLRDRKLCTVAPDALMLIAGR